MSRGPPGAARPGRLAGLAAGTAQELSQQVGGRFTAAVVPGHSRAVPMAVSPVPSPGPGTPLGLLKALSEGQFASDKNLRRTRARTGRGGCRSCGRGGGGWGYQELSAQENLALNNGESAAASAASVLPLSVRLSDCRLWHQMASLLFLPLALVLHRYAALSLAGPAFSAQTQEN